MATIQLADYVLFAFNVSDRSTLPGYPPSPLLTRRLMQQDYKVIATASPSRVFQKLLGSFHSFHWPQKLFGYFRIGPRKGIKQQNFLWFYYFILEQLLTSFRYKKIPLTSFRLLLSNVQRNCGLLVQSPFTDKRQPSTNKSKTPEYHTHLLFHYQS